MDEAPKDLGTQYTSNSRKSREAAKDAVEKTRPDEKKIEPIAGVTAKQTKTPLGRKIVALFKADDAQGVGNYLLTEVVVPTFKDLVTSIAREGVERMMYGDSRPASRSSSSRSGYTPYNRMSSSSSRNRDEPRAMSRTARATHDFRDIIVDDRGSADLVLERISDIINEYEVATVADLYELVHITPAFTDNKYGWLDLRGFNTRRVREGYLIVCPRPVVLD